VIGRPPAVQDVTRQGQVPDDDNTANIASVADVRGEFDWPAEAEVEALPPGSGMLVVKRGPNTGSHFRLDSAVATVGRHPASDIYLDDITVSRRHAEIHRDNAVFRIVDLGSLNSTYLNREPVESAELANGDEIQVGNFRLVFLAG
jgi:pSer/pThr/pTyr-binding forkhead associated (FHA) protein